MKLGQTEMDYTKNGCAFSGSRSSGTDNYPTSPDTESSGQPSLCYGRIVHPGYNRIFFGIQYLYISDLVFLREVFWVWSMVVVVIAKYVYIWVGE